MMTRTLYFFIGISVGFSTLESTTFEPIQTIVEEENGIQVTSIDKSKYKKAPDLVGIAHYINTTPEQLEKLKALKSERKEKRNVRKNKADGKKKN